MALRLKAMIQKTSAEGELLALEIKADELSEMKDGLLEAYDICDTRMKMMNERVLRAKQLMATFSPQEITKINLVLAVLGGEASAEAAINRLNIEMEDSLLKEDEYANAGN